MSSDAQTTIVLVGLFVACWILLMICRFVSNRVSEKMDNARSRNIKMNDVSKTENLMDRYKKGE